MARRSRRLRRCRVRPLAAELEDDSWMLYMVLAALAGWRLLPFRLRLVEGLLALGSVASCAAGLALMEAA